MIVTKMAHRTWEVFSYVEDSIGAFTWRTTYHGTTKREAMSRFREECRRLTQERERADALLPYWRRERAIANRWKTIAKPPVTNWNNQPTTEETDR